MGRLRRSRTHKAHQSPTKSLKTRRRTKDTISLSFLLPFFHSSSFFLLLLLFFFLFLSLIFFLLSRSDLLSLSLLQHILTRSLMTLSLRMPLGCWASLRMKTCPDLDSIIVFSAGGEFAHSLVPSFLFNWHTWHKGNFWMWETPWMTRHCKGRGSERNREWLNSLSFFFFSFSICVAGISLERQRWRHTTLPSCTRRGWSCWRRSHTRWQRRRLGLGWWKRRGRRPPARWKFPHQARPPFQPQSELNGKTMCGSWRLPK